MDPQYLLMEDFMGHRHTEIDCSLFRSVLIVGRDKNNHRESNGVGKTTIFYAIEYALFGSVPSDTIDEIIRDGCDECKVVFDFEINKGAYRIIRIRRKRSKKSYLELYKKAEDKWKNISQKTPTETNAELAKIIEINYKAFHNAVLFAQSDLRGLASDTPGERKATLKDALGLVVYKKFEEIGKKEAKEIKSKIDKSESVIKSLGEPQEDIDVYECKLKEIKDDIDKLEKERAFNDIEYKNRRSDLDDLKRLVSSGSHSLHDKLDDIKRQKQEANDDLTDVSLSLQDTSVELSNLEKEIQSDRDSVKSLQDRLEEKKKIPTRKIDEIKDELQLFIDREINGKGFVASLDSKIKELKEPLPDGDVCPHCRQPMSQEHKEECAKRIKEELEQKEADLIMYGKRLTACMVKKKGLEKELNDTHNHNDLLERMRHTIHNTESDIQRKEVYRDKVKAIKQEKENKKKSYEDKVIVLKKKEQSLLSSLEKSESKEIDNKILIIQEKLEELENKSEELIRNLSHLNTSVGVYQEKAQVSKKDLQKLEKEKKKQEKLKNEYENYLNVIQGFSSSGIPTMVIYNILDDLQIEVNKLLDDLKPGLELQFTISKEKVDGEMEETLDIIFRVHGKDRSYKLLSGGQKFLFSVSLKLGLSLIIQKRLGVNIKFLELDEVDQALDKAAVDTYADVIRRWQDNFKIFVITHNDSLKDKFTHAILVEGDGNNGATASVVTDW